ncbi:MAG: outer membrane lipoprotein carrier protein LolA [Candidatus Sumerlaeaceae bacterium]|nr:outer membrane lipoprotein carrier protein LolA [Candidatus Sumerlaeaceae bacterium]
MRNLSRFSLLIAATLGATVLASAADLRSDRSTTPSSASTDKLGEKAVSAPAGKVIEILKSLEERYAGVKTIRGTFSQTTLDQTFGEKIESQGVFYLKKPNRLRIDYNPPHETTLLVSERMMYRYIPQLKQVERYRIDPTNSIVEVNYMLLGFGASTQDILGAYRVTLAGEKPGEKTTQVLRLVPQRSEEASFKTIEMIVDTERRIPLEFRVTQLDGTVATVKLDPSALTLDVPLDDKLFRPSFAPDAQIVDVK